MKNGESTKLTHCELVEVGRKWLSSRSPVVLTEIKSISEEPDVFGLNADLKFVVEGCTKYIGYGSTLIECKATRSDFRADQKKPFRRESYRGIGRYRFYLTPKGLLNIDELPSGWGLLETTGSRVKCLKWPCSLEFSLKSEIQIIVSAFRRLNIAEGAHTSIKVYKYETKNTASLTLSEEV